MIQATLYQARVSSTKRVDCSSLQHSIVQILINLTMLGLLQKALNLSGSSSASNFNRDARSMSPTATHSIICPVKTRLKPLTGIEPAVQTKSRFLMKKKSRLRARVRVRTKVQMRSSRMKAELHSNAREMILTCSLRTKKMNQIMKF